jgi:hypothetical protein
MGNALGGPQLGESTWGPCLGEPLGGHRLEDPAVGHPLRNHLLGEPTWGTLENPLGWNNLGNLPWGNHLGDPLGNPSWGHDWGNPIVGSLLGDPHCGNPLVSPLRDPHLGGHVVVDWGTPLRVNPLSDPIGDPLVYLVCYPLGGITVGTPLLVTPSGNPHWGPFEGPPLLGPPCVTTWGNPLRDDLGGTSLVTTLWWPPLGNRLGDTPWRTTLETPWGALLHFVLPPFQDHPWVTLLVDHIWGRPLGIRFVDPPCSTPCGSHPGEPPSGPIRCTNLRGPPFEDHLGNPLVLLTFSYPLGWPHCGTPIGRTPYADTIGDPNFDQTCVTPLLDPPFVTKFRPLFDSVWDPPLGPLHGYVALDTYHGQRAGGPS